MIFLIQQWCSYATAHSSRLSVKMIGKMKQRKTANTTAGRNELKCIVFDFDVESVLKRIGMFGSAPRSVPYVRRT